mgnify:CR=1 FL=1
MKFERSELGALFSKLRTAVPEVRAVGTDDAGILLSGSNAYATNLELSVRAGLSKPVEQDVVVPPRGVDFISGTVAPEISIEADKGILTVKSGTARARLNTTPAENYPEFSGPGNDAKRCIVGANDLSWAISKVLYTEPLEHCSPARISIGCDVARFGNDDTAIAQNIDGDIQKLVTRHGQDLYATADDIIAIYKALRAAYPQYRGLIYAVIDDTGVGGGVTDILNREKIRQKLTKLMVVPVNFSSAVPDKEAAGRYADIATWMWAVLRDMATAGTLHIPNDSTLIGQLTTRKYIFAGTPLKLKLEGKDALKKRGLTSPDRADAVALALYEGGIFDVRSLI